MNIVFLALIQKHVKYALQFYYCNNQYVSRIDVFDIMYVAWHMKMMHLQENHGCITYVQISSELP